MNLDKNLVSFCPIVNEWNVAGGAGGRNGSEGCMSWKCLACRAMEGSEGWRGSVRSCGGRKDDVRQENHGNSRTGSRKPVNLGNNTLA